MTGETQLRARRTRIKILKAIADKNGVAGFSDIKLSTGLSTGSIYYHLERMGNYVTKDSKHYIITEEGLQLLREVDPKYYSLAAPKKVDELRQQTTKASAATTTSASATTTTAASTAATAAGSAASSSKAEETVRQAQYWSGSVLRNYYYYYVFAGLFAFAVAIGAVSMFTNGQALSTFFSSFGSGVMTINVTAATAAGVLLSIIVTAALSISFIAVTRRRIHFGYRGILISVTVLAAVFAIVLIVSGLQYSGASSQPHNNSMDALLSSYSLHWQIR